MGTQAMTYYPQIATCTYCDAPGSSCSACHGTGFIPTDEGGDGDGALEYLQRLVGVLTSTVNQMHADLARMQQTTSEIQASTEQHRADARRSATEYWASLRESNQHLRAEVQFLAETMGLKPVRVNDHPYLPRNDSVKPILADGDASRPAEAIRVMIRHVLKDELSDDAITEDSIREYIRQSIDGVLNKAVRHAMGVEEGFGRTKFHHDSLVKSKVDAIVKPALDAIVAEKVPAAIAALQLDEIVSDWLRDELRDQFIHTLRREIRDGVMERARDLAHVAVTDTADTIIMDEMPFLRKYLAIKKLGNDLSDE